MTIDSQSSTDDLSLPRGPGMVVVLTGPPGAGKSTVGRLLADSLAASVLLSADDFWDFIRKRRIPPYLPEARQQNRTVIGIVADAAFGYADAGYQVVCDGVLGPWFIDVFRTAASARAIPLHYVVLRPDQNTVLSRATGRGEGALTDPEPIRSLYRQFAELGALEGHVLDSTRLTSQVTAETILQGIEDDRFLLAV
ncbi:MAG: AAA family ATPase [Streptosporangiaceae bacterium]